MGTSARLWRRRPPAGGAGQTAGPLPFKDVAPIGPSRLVLRASVGARVCSGCGFAIGDLDEAFFGKLRDEAVEVALQLLGRHVEGVAQGFHQMLGGAMFGQKTPDLVADAFEAEVSG